MSSASQIVTDMYGKAGQYASQAQQQLTQFTGAFSDAIYAPTAIKLEWSTPTFEGVADRMGEVPDVVATNFVVPSGMPTPLNEMIPAIQIDDFTESAPPLLLPSAPVLQYGAVPTIPGISAIALPSSPEVAEVVAPQMLSLSPVNFPGIDMHASWLDKLDEVPELTILAPTPYSYARGPQYASLLLDNLKAKLNERIAGGTGLNPAVEQKIWDRARAREASTARGAEAEVLRNGEALGYMLPPGVVVHQLREAQFSTANKMSELSREIAIKQADLEQANMKDTIASGMQLEQQLTEYSLKLEQMTFDAAKATAENAIQIHNAELQRFQALLEGYKAYATGYKTLIDAELSKVEVFKAQLQGEQTKADINRALVEQYKAAISAGMARVEIYKAQVSAAQTLVELEKAKISAAGEQIRGFVAQINAETAKVEVYKAAVEGERTKQMAFKTQVEAYGAKVGAQAEKSRALTARYSALQQAKAGEWDGWRAKIQAEVSRMEGDTSQELAKLSGYKARAEVIAAKTNIDVRKWESTIQQYAAGKSLLLQTEKQNSDVLMWANNARLDAAKAGAQVYAQLTASAYNMVNAGASISGSGSNSVSYSYSGEISGTAPPAVV